MTKGSLAQEGQLVLLHFFQQEALSKLAEVVNQRRRRDSDGVLTARYTQFDPRAVHEITQAALAFVLSMETEGLLRTDLHRQIEALLRGAELGSPNKVEGEPSESP